MKTLSIIIPIYNTPGKYFSKCLASLQCQQMDELEVIAVDDGSLERNSNEIKAQIEKSPLTIRYYKKENGGQNSAREYGLTKAVGQFVFFMDADDYVDTGALDQVIGLLKKNNPNILAFNYDVRAADGTVLKKYNRWQGTFNKINVVRGLLYTDSLCLQIYKKEAFEKSGIHLVQGARIGEDMASATALLATIGEAWSTDECVYHYIKHPGSALSAPPKDAALDMVRAFEAMLEQLDGSIQKKYHTELEWLAILHVLYYNTERILQSYQGNKVLMEDVRKWIEERYPPWRRNPYLKSEKIAGRIPFILITHDHTLLLKILRGAKRRLKVFL